MRLVLIKRTFAETGWPRTLQNALGQTCIATTTTYVTTESVLFASDGTYLQPFRMATGNCPFSDSSGTVIMAIDTIGNYSLQGNNTNVPGFYKIMYTPSKFAIALVKNQKPIYYTTQNPGPCDAPVSYWNNYCPCNSTWAANASYNATLGFYDNARTIVKSDCPNNTCNETFFLSDQSLYGNLQFSQDQNTGIRTVLLTITSTNSTLGYSYNASDIAYTFTSTNTSCQSSIYPTPAPAPSIKSSSNVINICTFLLLGMILWLKLN